jgi:hypothetical protein
MTSDLNSKSQIPSPKFQDLQSNNFSKNNLTYDPLGLGIWSLGLKTLVLSGNQ